MQGGPRPPSVSRGKGLLAPKHGKKMGGKKIGRREGEGPTDLPVRAAPVCVGPATGRRRQVSPETTDGERNGGGASLARGRPHECGATTNGEGIGPADECRPQMETGASPRVDLDRRVPPAPFRPRAPSVSEGEPGWPRMSEDLEPLECGGSHVGCAARTDLLAARLRPGNHTAARRRTKH